MAENNDGGADVGNQTQGLPTMTDSVTGLVAAMSSVFTSIATDKISSDGSIRLSDLPAFLEITANILKEINNQTNGSVAAEEVADQADPAQTTDVAKEEPTVVFEDEWKLAISKSTGKVLGIFPDNALAQRWFSDECEEEIASKNALSSYDSAVQRCREQVDVIIKECRRTNTKFRDPDWNLGDYGMCLVGLDSADDEYEVPPQGFAQARKIFNDPQFYVNEATASDIKQGNVGDCWVLAAIAALTNFQACLTQNYVKVEGDEQVGVFGFVFHRDGEWIYEIVDDFLYTKHPRFGEIRESFPEGTLARNLIDSLTEEKYNSTYAKGADALYFAQSRDENETWLPLMEKAFAKAHGDYYAISGGNTGEAIEDLTGGITTEIRTEDILDVDRVWQELELCNVQFIFGCSTPKWDHNRQMDQGISSGHAYSVMKAVEVPINGKFERLLLIRNPWGDSEWTGRYSDGSQEMTASLLTQLDHKPGDDGMFYMSFKDFLRKFQFLARIRLIGNDWSCAQLWTNLKIPRTTTFLETKYVFTLNREDLVVISLSQLDDRYIRGLRGQYDFELEFKIEKDTPADAGKVIARSSRGIRTNRSVNTEVRLEAGRYNVFLKIVAFFDHNRRPIKECIKDFVASPRKAKLIQIAKKYNFAHMKHGVGEKEDQVFESLIVEEDAEADPPQQEPEIVASTDDGPQENSSDATDNQAQTVDAGNAGQPADVPVESPVTAEPKPTSLAQQKVEDEPKKEKKDKSIQNWDPVATIGLRLFTRKAKVTLSVVQPVDSTAATEAPTSADAATNDTPPPSMTLLRVESTKVGNVPAIGDPLPMTPAPVATDADKTIVNTKIDTVPQLSSLGSPRVAFLNDRKDANTMSESSYVLVNTNTNTSSDITKATTSSHPLAMAESTIQEGAEKAEDAKIPSTLASSTKPTADTATEEQDTDVKSTSESPKTSDTVVVTPDTTQPSSTDGQLEPEPEVAQGITSSEAVTAAK